MNTNKRPHSPVWDWVRGIVLGLLFVLCCALSLMVANVVPVWP